MKIWRVEFTPIWPVGGCCIIAAKDKAEAERIARKTITHKTDIAIFEVPVKSQGVIVYLSGDY